MDFAQALSERMPALKIQKDVVLAPFTSMRVGGKADLFLELDSEQALRAALLAAADTNTPVFLLGNGSNLVIKDGGILGLTIHMGDGFSKITAEDERLTAEAGALLSVLARRAQAEELTGLEFAAGIPGSLGGAVVMNAGAYGGEMAQVIEWVDILFGDTVRRVPAAEMRFSYRHSLLMDEKGVVLRVGLLLKKGDRQAISDMMNDLAARRRNKQPLAFPSAGSFFKRPQGYFAGALIEAAGMKGARVGGAQVSEKHAGFIINTGGASARDVLGLMERVREAVLQQAGVALEPEARIVGRDA